MCAAIGIPTTRVSDLFVRQRMLAQVSSDQLALFKVQQQIASGQRIQLPSEDSRAALRIVGYQQLLSRISQLQVNLKTNQSYLTATDSAMGTITDLLASVRGDVLGAVGTTVSDTQRAAAALQVTAVMQQLVDTGNQQYRGRQIFSGSDTAVTPFEFTKAGNVIYNGDEKHLQSYADLDLLFQTNYTGQEVFGAISAEVCSDVNMTPILKNDTLLSDLHGGSGVSLGSIVLSTGAAHSTTIDLSDAKTVGDVASIIHAKAAVDVEITNSGLRIILQGTGSLTIREAGEGTTAKDLGILVDSAGQSYTGADLDPRLVKTTRIDDIATFGTRAIAYAHFGAYDNDLVFEAGTIGDDLNDTPIEMVYDEGVKPGEEIVDWDGSKLTIRIKEGESTAAEVAAAVHEKFAAGDIPIDCWVDPIDDRHGGANVVGEYSGELDGGSGDGFDRSGGLQIVNDDQTHVVDFASTVTVEDLLNRLNLSGAGILAEINSAGDSINIRSRVSGCDFAIGENGGQTATELGLRTFTGDTRLDALNYGRGIFDGQSNGTETDITITADGASGTVTFAIDVDDCNTVQDVISLINGDATNAGRIHAQLTTDGNGIDLIDTAGFGSITVARANQSFAANGLGLIEKGQTTRTVTATSGNTAFDGTDVNPQETAGAFTALARIQQALETNDQGELARGMEMLDAAASQVTFMRAKLAVQQQSLDSIQEREENQQLQLKASLSEDYDTDYAEAVSDFTGKQIAYQASLKAAAAIFQMTLLDFL
jgi:flagellin-like hook-associated protein FlgL